tara:strand:+ start:315 stop:578 length:264 start_codon:yes stop_codon:yes gene_type:complete
LTYGGFLIFFCLYISPVIREANYKIICIKLSEKAAVNKFNEDNIKETLLKETGLTIKELAKIESYKNCDNKYMYWLTKNINLLFFCY